MPAQREQLRVTLNMDRCDFTLQAPPFPLSLAEGAAGKRGKLWDNLIVQTGIQPTLNFHTSCAEFSSSSFSSGVFSLQHPSVSSSALPWEYLGGGSDTHRLEEALFFFHLHGVFQLQGPF